MNNQQIIKLLEAGAFSVDLIRDLIEQHAERRAEMLRLYHAYRAEDLPILDRTLPEGKKNNKLVNNYRGEIVDQLTGYLYGKPVTYLLHPREGQSDAAYEAASERLEQTLRLSHINKLDLETGKLASICGYAARLCYIDREARPRTMVVPPWECIFIRDGSIDEPQYALRYYAYTVVKGGVEQELIRAEWYDRDNITFYIENTPGGQFILDDSEANPLPHNFRGYVPLIEFANNEERQGDFEKVESLIDAYDLTLSDAQNEIEEFRLAYLACIGAVLDRETIEAARETGGFSLSDKDATLGFITKDINDTFLENHKGTLQNNIYRFSKTVDMSDEKFSGGGESGESRKWKLLSLDGRAAVHEIEFMAASHVQFETLCAAWKVSGIDIDAANISITVDRNTPMELSSEAETTGKLKGLVSERTRLENLSIVRDVDREMEQMQEDAEMLPRVRLDDTTEPA